MCCTGTKRGGVDRDGTGLNRWFNHNRSRFLSLSSSRPTMKLLLLALAALLATVAVLAQPGARVQVGVKVRERERERGETTAIARVTLGAVPAVSSPLWVSCVWRARAKCGGRTCPAALPPSGGTWREAGRQSRWRTVWLAHAAPPRPPPPLLPLAVPPRQLRRQGHGRRHDRRPLHGHPDGRHQVRLVARPGDAV